MTSVFEATKLRGHRRMMSVALRFLALSACLVAGTWASSYAGEPRTVAFLGVHFENDNAMYEPTSDAERKRIARLEAQFKTALNESGQFEVVALPPALLKKIEEGQPVGACGGCEMDYAASVGAQTVAWITVQKVSNLILNLNVYIADVSQNKMIFVRSVDIRGNTDEMWERSLDYLVKNYLFPKQS